MQPQTTVAKKKKPIPPNLRGCVMHFGVAQEKITQAIATLAPMVKEQDREMLSEVERKLKENKFNLVVLGQFKRGKTTFINALLGEKLLPSAILPLTSIVTTLEYGPQMEVEVHFLNGQVKKIEPQNIRLYVTEKENPQNEKGVKYVRVLHPASILKKGIILVDTPGVGSLYENNTDVTYGFLPRVDAGVFLLTVDPPLSKEEIAFLKDVYPHVERIFFVLNKVDYVDSDDLQEVMDFALGNLEEALGSNHIPIYPLSAKMALEGRTDGDEGKVVKSGIADLEEALEDFLLKEKGSIVLRSSANKVLSLLSTSLFQVELEIKAATTPLEELEEKIERFRDIKEEIGQERRDSEFLFKGEIDSLIKIVNMDMERFQTQKIPKIYARLLETFQENKHRGSLELSKLLDQAMKEILVREFDQMVIQENEKVNAEYSRIARRFADKVNDIIDRLMVLAAELFEIPLERFQVEENITEESSLWYKLEDRPKLLDLEGAGKFISYSILPSAMVHKMIKAELQKKLPEKVDMNCGRVRSDFVDRITKSAIELRWGMEQKMNQTVAFVEEAVQKAMKLRGKSQEEVEATLKELEKKKALMEGIKEQLKSLLEGDAA